MVGGGAQDAEAQAAGNAQDDGEAQEVGAAQEEADGEPKIVLVPSSEDES